MAINPITGVPSFRGSAADADNTARSLAGAFRTRNTNVPADALGTFKTKTPATVASENNDWRVKLEVPESYLTSPVLEPLRKTDNSMVFPFTPTIILQHSANYSQVQPVHSNYPFPVYESSRIENIIITGDFYVETPEDAKYWIAVQHFLRSITKMFYGDTSNAGAPPPITRLSGYGEFVFNRVPNVLQTYTTELPQDVDYIKTIVPGSSAESWAPASSIVSITLMPVYSRDTVRQFSLDTFVNGGYILDDKGFI